MEENKQQKTNLLRELRMRAHLSQKQAARKVGLIDATLLSRYERGRVLPPLATALKLSVLYQTTLQTIFPGLSDQIRAEIIDKPRRTGRARTIVFAPEGPDS